MKQESPGREARYPDPEGPGDAKEYTGLLTSADIVSGAAISYRQCDFWTGRGFLRPERTWRGRRWGSGSPRIWSRAELDVARTMGRLVRARLSLEAAHEIARSGESRIKLGPGIWLELGPALSGPCGRDDHGGCFPDEPADCGCECHEVTA